MPMIARFLTAIVFILSLAPAAWAAAGQDNPEVVRVTTHARDGRLLVDADVRFELNDTVRDAAERGVPLFFTADLQISRSRWWWFDRDVVDSSMTLRIVYNALTRQWRAGLGQLTLPTQSLDDAMSQIRSIRGWDVGPSDTLDAGVHYEGRMRVRLDTSMLPRAFQVNALNSSSWAPATQWFRFAFSPSDAQAEAP